MIHKTIKDKLCKVQFIDKIKYYPYESYQSAISKYLDNIPLDGILSVYQVGSIRNPGISDIDLLIVFKDLKRDLFGKYSVSRLSEENHYLFSHNPLLMDVATFRNLNLWFPFFHLNNLYGEDFDLDFSKKGPEISIILLAKYLVTKLPLDLFICGFMNNEFRERTMLSQMNSLRHSISLAKEIFTTIPEEWQIFSDEYYDFIGSYFEMTKDDRLRNIFFFISVAFKVCFDLINAVAIYIENNVLEIPIENNSTFKPAKWVTIYFEKKWNEENALRTLFFSGSKHLKLSLPSNLGCFLLAWSALGSFIGKHINRSLTNPEKVILKPSFAFALKEHALTVERHFEFHSAKFRAAPSGYYTYWAPVHRMKIMRTLYRVDNGFRPYLAKCFRPYGTHKNNLL